MPIRPNTQGFSIAWLIAAIFTIATLSIAGFFIWQKNNNNKDNNTQQPSSHTSQTDNNQSNTTKPADPSEGGKYLVIREWGVRIPLSDELAGAYYKHALGDSADYVSLYDSAFDGLKNANEISCGGSHVYALYSISRAKPQDVAAQGDIYQAVPFTKDYVFSGIGAHQAPPYCANLSPGSSGEVQYDDNILDIANNKERAFDNAFKELQASN